MQKSDTLVITSYPPRWQQLAEVTCATHKAYADAHGYDYFADCSDLQDSYYNYDLRTHFKVGIAGFIKMDLFLHFLPKYQSVVWLDADLLVTNKAVPVQSFRSPGVTVPFDHNGINATVIIANSTDLVYDFFWAVNNTGRKLFLGHDWKEMEAMRYFSQTPPYDKLLTYYSIKELCPILADEYIEAGLPRKVSGKYGWVPGDWTMHLSALPLEVRIDRARYYADAMALL